MSSGAAVRPGPRVPAPGHPPRRHAARPAGRPPHERARSRFLLGFLLAALIIAGGLSYLASPDPDGLDSVTLHGCTVSETAHGAQLDGTCIAQHATGHTMADGPLAGYAVGGHAAPTASPGSSAS